MASFRDAAGIKDVPLDRFVQITEANDQVLTLPLPRSVARVDEKE